ncbi:MAG: hypothetical protein JW982_11890 [Spirochaetes bacterium]|nr:hypothetical protein [Spirochaetota bacterium]
MKNEILENDISYYTSYWQKNLESIEEITVELKKLILNLEDKHLNENELHESIESKINLLLTIYSSYNSIKGREYLQKIKALYKKYNHFYKKQSICLNTINYMMQKIDEEKNTSLSNFPGLKHEEPSIDKFNQGEYRYSRENRYNHKWLCFSRNGSRFIINYDTIKIISVSENDIVFSEENLYLNYNDTRKIITDLFHESVFCKNRIPSTVIIKDNSVLYGADSIDKKFLANKDILSASIKKYNFFNSVADGYLKLGGKRYIMLK